MFSIKHLIGLLLTSFLFVSCTPFPPYQGAPNPNGPQVKTPATPKTPAELIKDEELRKKRLKANAEAKARREAVRKEKEANGGLPKTGGDVIPPVKREASIVSRTRPATSCRLATTRCQRTDTTLTCPLRMAIGS